MGLVSASYFLVESRSRSVGMNPPKAPLDITRMTSPERRCLNTLVAQGGDHLVDVELFVDRDLVVRLRHSNRRNRGTLECAGVLHLVDVAPAGVRPRLEYRPEPPVRIALANAVDCLAHGRGVVREVVDHEHTVNLGANLLAAFHSLE
jgi:hypothetical protein